MRFFSIHKEGATYTWGVEALWEKTKAFPTVQIPLSDFEHTLDWDCWKEGLTPRSLLNHAQRMFQADMSCPLLVVRSENKVVRVIDGMHRIVRGFVDSVEELPVREIDESWLYLQCDRIFSPCEVCECEPCDCDWGEA